MEYIEELMEDTEELFEKWILIVDKQWRIL